MRVSVVGGSAVSDERQSIARRVGREVGERGHELVCGGRGGVMRAACRGAREAGAHTVGILPGEEPAAANPHVETAIATGIGHARNPLVVMNGEAVVAVDGGPGTLSEIGHALVYDRPVAGIDTHDVEGVHAVGDASAALDVVEREV
jgi:hypothetical protein